MLLFIQDIHGAFSLSSSASHSPHFYLFHARSELTFIFAFQTDNYLLKANLEFISCACPYPSNRLPSSCLEIIITPMITTLSISSILSPCLRLHFHPHCPHQLPPPRCFLQGPASSISQLPINSLLFVPPRSRVIQVVPFPAQHFTHFPLHPQWVR
jgi:hypothetical protein